MSVGSGKPSRRSKPANSRVVARKHATPRTLARPLLSIKQNAISQNVGLSVAQLSFSAAAQEQISSQHITAKKRQQQAPEQQMEITVNADSKIHSKQQRKNKKQQTIEMFSMSSLYASLTAYMSKNATVSTIDQISTNDDTAHKSRTKRMRRQRHFNNNSISTLLNNDEFAATFFSNKHTDNIDLSSSAYSSSSEYASSSKSHYSHESADFTADAISHSHNDHHNKKYRHKRTNQFDNASSSVGMLAGAMGIFGALGGAGQATYDLFNLFSFGPLVGAAEGSTEMTPDVFVGGELAVTDDG